jgi:hypothetical protein
MGEIMKKLTMFLAVAILFISCELPTAQNSVPDGILGGIYDPDRLVGVWVWQSNSFQQQNTIVDTFRFDGSYTEVATSPSGASMTWNGTWSLVGNKLTIIEPGDATDYIFAWETFPTLFYTMRTKWDDAGVEWLKQ